MQFDSLLGGVVLPLDLLDLLHIGILQIDLTVELVHLHVPADSDGGSGFKDAEQLVLRILSNLRFDKNRRIPVGQTDIDGQFAAVPDLLGGGAEHGTEDGNAFIGSLDRTNRHRIFHHEAVAHQHLRRGHVELHAAALDDALADNGGFRTSLKERVHASEIGLVRRCISIGGNGGFCRTGRGCGSLSCGNLGGFFTKPRFPGRFVVLIMIGVIGGLHDLYRALHAELTADDACQDLAGFGQIQQIDPALQKGNADLDGIAVFHDLIPVKKAIDHTADALGLTQHLIHIRCGKQLRGIMGE